MQNLICAQLGRAPASDPCAVKSANLRSVAGSKVAAEQRLGPAGEQKFVYLLCSHCMAARLRLRAGVIPTRNWQINPVAAQYRA